MELWFASLQSRSPFRRLRALSGRHSDSSLWHPGQNIAPRAPRLIFASGVPQAGHGAPFLPVEQIGVIPSPLLPYRFSSNGAPPASMLPAARHAAPATMWQSPRLSASGSAVADGSWPSTAASAHTHSDPRDPILVEQERLDRPPPSLQQRPELLQRQVNGVRPSLPTKGCSARLFT